MRFMRGIEVGLAVMALSVPFAAQRNQRPVLTDAQVDQIREAGIFPDERIKLYTKFVGEHVDTIKDLTGRRHSMARAQKLDQALQDLASLMDELGSNLDQYGDREADIRKSLKGLNEEIPKWQEALKALPSEPVFDLSQKDAIDASKDLADQAAQMMKDQDVYFKLHKDEKGQERAEPKPQ